MAKKEDIIKELEKEIILWENLKEYVGKNLKGKTLTKSLEKEIDFMLGERKSFLKNIQNS